MSVSSYGNQDWEREREVDTIKAVLEAQGPLDRDALAAAVRARQWRPGRFRSALRAALDEGAITRLGKGRFRATATRTTPTTSGAPRPA